VLCCVLVQFYLPVLAEPIFLSLFACFFYQALNFISLTRAEGLEDPLKKSLTLKLDGREKFNLRIPASGAI